MIPPFPTELSGALRVRARSARVLGLAVASTFFVAAALRCLAADAECLRVQAGSAPYGDWSISDIVWGDGYPTVNASFSADESLVFGPADGGGYRQKIGTNALTPGTDQNDNPAFTSTYPSILRLNALIADMGTITMTYTLTFATELVDIIISDVDEGDSVVVSATDGEGASVPPTEFRKIAEGDLSLTINAGGRPPLELATPPLWNPSTGAVAAQVAWNENRSYTILRPLPGKALKSITLTFTGNRADPDGPSGASLGSHIYAALWATPRKAEIQHFAASNSTQFLIRWTSLPGLAYRIETNGDLSNVWVPVMTVPGAAAPAITTETTIPIPASAPTFYRVVRP